MSTKSKWSNIIEATACEECGAEKGSRCKSGSGYPTTIPHLKRRLAGRLEDPEYDPEQAYNFEKQDAEYDQTLSWEERAQDEESNI